MPDETAPSKDPETDPATDLVVPFLRSFMVEFALLYCRMVLASWDEHLLSSGNKMTRIARQEGKRRWLHGCRKYELVRPKTYCAANPLDVAGTVVTWPREVSDPSSLTRNPISAPVPETL